MIEFGVFNTLVVDELNQHVTYGPTPSGEWIEIGTWGERELEVLVAIASHPRGACAHDAVRRANHMALVDRRTVHRIRERFRRDGGLPKQHADEMIVTKKLSGIYALNTRIRPHFPSPRIHGAGEHGEARAMDSMLLAIMHAGPELFGASAFRDAVALLPDHVRRDTFEIKHPYGRWIPVPYVTSWMRAVFDGPAKQSPDAYTHFVRLVERYRVSPNFLEYIDCQKARLSDIKRMWRTCYDSGRFEAYLGKKNDFLELRLWNHPYCQSERAARVFALCWRALSEIFKAHEPHIDVCEFEGLSGALRIRIAGTFVS